MYRKLEKAADRSVKPEVKRASTCTCNCSEFAQKGEKIMPVESSLKNQVSAHFVVKG